MYGPSPIEAVGSQVQDQSRKASHFQWMLLALLVLGVTCTLARAGDIHVPRDCSSLADALEGAQDGDRVLVAPGTYEVERRVWLRNSIDVIGTGGARETFVLIKIPPRRFGEPALPLFLSSLPDSPLNIEGFTFMVLPKDLPLILHDPHKQFEGLPLIYASGTFRRNVLKPAPGIARLDHVIALWWSSLAALIEPEVTDNVISGFHVAGEGAIWKRNRITNCTTGIKDATAAYENYIEVDWVPLAAVVSAVGNTLIGSEVMPGTLCQWRRGSMYYFAYNYVEANRFKIDPCMVIERNVFLWRGARPERGNLLFMYLVTFGNITFVGNTVIGLPGEKLFYAQGHAYEQDEIAWNIFWRPEYGGGEPIIEIRDPPSAPFFHHNFISDPASELVGENGNTSADPLLVDPLRGDVRPLPGSPCIDVMTEGDLDPDGSPRDAGAVPFDHAAPWFLRGDLSGDGQARLNDAILLLGYLFASADPACALAGDFDDDNSLQLADAVLLLNYLLARGSPPKAPFPEIGIDPTPGDLPCGL